MTSFIVSLITAFACLMSTCSCALDRTHVENKDHLKEHYHDMVDFDKMSAEELKFHYFKVHDVEGNDKLDGCELVQSLLHFHVEESSDYGVQPRSLSDVELSTLVDSVLLTDDKNLDGFIDYSEFVSGQISKGL